MGKFIVLYGVNNLGKSTQLGMLASALSVDGTEVVTRKSPNYETPSGQAIYKLLRSQMDPVGETELQLGMCVNLQHDNQTIRNDLAAGKTVISEDYFGTTLAWAAGKDARMDVIRPMLEGLVEPDVSILLHGKRFLDSKEAGHIHEQNDDLTERVQQHHLELADEFGWHKVNANQAINQVHADIMAVVGRGVEVQ